MWAARTRSRSENTGVYTCQEASSGGVPGVVSEETLTPSCLRNQVFQICAPLLVHTSYYHKDAEKANL